MYEVSEALAAALATQILQIRVTCGETVLGPDQVTSLRYSATCGGEQVITVGGVTAAMVSMTVAGRLAWTDEVITVEVGAEVSGSVQYVPLGIFAVAECNRGEHSTEMTAYDAVYYVLGESYTPTFSDSTTEVSVSALLSDVAGQCGLTLAELPYEGSSGCNPLTTMIPVEKLPGHTCREMVSCAAALIGCNAYINRNGALALTWFKYSDCLVKPDDYTSLTLVNRFRIDYIACTVHISNQVEGELDRTLIEGRRGPGKTGIAFRNDYMTQGYLHNIWYNVGGMRFTTGSISMIGGLLLEPGDMVLMRELDETSYRFPVQSLDLNIDGGCHATLQATGIGSAEDNANIYGTVAERLRKIEAAIAARH